MAIGSESIEVGVIVERRATSSRWQPFVWRPLGVVTGASGEEAPRVVYAGQGVVHYHLANVPITVHRRETEGYKRNLSDSPPKVYLVLRFEGESLPEVALATVCPYEAQDYLDSADADEMVEPVPMPEAVAAWLAEYVERHHVDEPFEKRKRKRWVEEGPRREAPIRVRGND